jgi:hypothetical protein
MTRVETVYQERTLHAAASPGTHSRTAVLRPDKGSSNFSASSARDIREEKRDSRQVCELGAGKIDSKFN